MLMEAWAYCANPASGHYDGDRGVPRVWGGGLARLDPSRPPADVPHRRWVRFLDDCGRAADFARPN
jgi:hypothetical protein